MVCAGPNDSRVLVTQTTPRPVFTGRYWSALGRVRAGPLHRCCSQAGPRPPTGPKRASQSQEPPEWMGTDATAPGPSPPFSFHHSPENRSFEKMPSVLLALKLCPWLTGRLLLFALAAGRPAPPARAPGSREKRPDGGAGPGKRRASLRGARPTVRGCREPPRPVAPSQGPSGSADVSLSSITVTAQRATCREVLSRDTLINLCGCIDPPGLEDKVGKLIFSLKE